jgi:hypothetical protein
MISINSKSLGWKLELWICSRIATLCTIAIHLTLGMANVELERVARAMHMQYCG